MRGSTHARPFEAEEAPSVNGTAERQRRRGVGERGCGEPRPCLGDTRVPAPRDGYWDGMTDPRNIAHDKKTASDKEARGEEVAPGADETPQPGKKPHMEHHESEDTEVDPATVHADGGR